MSYKTYKMTIKAKSTFITPIQSDTLFGQMIWAIKYTQNDEMVEKIIQETKDRNPPFVFSNPIVDDEYPLFGKLTEKYFEEVDKHFSNKIEAADLKKRNKRRSFVSSEVFQELIEGKKIEDIYIEILNKKRDFTTLKKTNQNMNILSKENLKLQTTSTKYSFRERNSINRLNIDSDDDNSRLFSQDEINYNGDVVLFINIHSEFNIKIFEKAFQYIQYNGYGKKASSGKGQFEVLRMEPYNEFNNESKYNKFIVLSNFLPNEKDDISVIEGKTFTKKSKSYGDNPHKNYFIAYREGSYFTGDSNKIKGRVLENINPKDPKVIQNLIPFCVGVKDE